MPYSQDSFSSYWLILWVIVFFSGLFFLFSALLGYSLFSASSSGIKGPYLFSSDGENAIAVDGEVLEKGEALGKASLGSREFCFSRFFANTRCITGKIRSNKHPLLEHKEVFLLSRSPRVDTITREEVFFDPKGEGFVWHDPEKKLFFGMRSDQDDFFVQDVPERFLALRLDEKQQKIFIEKEEETEKILDKKPVKNIENQQQESKQDGGDQVENEERKTESSQEYIVFTHFFSEVPSVEGIFSHRGKSKLEVSRSSFLHNDLLLSSFFPRADAVISFRENYFLVFESSVWIFFPEDQSFQKIFVKSPGSQVFFHAKTKTFFFLHQGELQRLFL